MALKMKENMGLDIIKQVKTCLKINKAHENPN